MKKTTQKSRATVPVKGLFKNLRLITGGSTNPGLYFEFIIFFLSLLFNFSCTYFSPLLFLQIGLEAKTTN